MRKQLDVVVLATTIAISCLGTSAASEVRPSQVKTCEDVRAYIDADNSMTMDTFRTLLTAAGADLSAGGNHALDNECKMTAHVKNLVMIQSVLKRDDGSVVSVSTQVIEDNGTCKLVHISLAGC